MLTLTPRVGIGSRPLRTRPRSRAAPSPLTALILGAPGLIIRFTRPALIGTHQTFFVVPNKVFPASRLQGLDNQPAILWVAVLNKRSLHCFFMRRAWAVHFFHGARVDPCEIDTRGNGAGRWIEVLHLFGVKAHIAAELRQLYSLF